MSPSKKVHHGDNVFTLCISKERCKEVELNILERRQVFAAELQNYFGGVNLGGSQTECDFGHDADLSPICLWKVIGAPEGYEEEPEDRFVSCRESI